MPRSSSQEAVTTRLFWRDRTGHVLSEEDAREAVANVSSFFSLLATWDTSLDLGDTEDAASQQEQNTPPPAGPAEAKGR